MEKVEGIRQYTSFTCGSWPGILSLCCVQRKLMEKVEGILAVHEFHVWQLAGDLITVLCAEEADGEGGGYPGPGSTRVSRVAAGRGSYRCVVCRGS